MDILQLKEKAAGLPYAPGVYLMKDKHENVIYVGKAKKLKNRVSQYFQDNNTHSPKTQLMVSKINSFDVIVAASEFEALVLECSLIKRYMPKYNILLKDDKGYPYIRLDLSQAYPKLQLANRLEDDGAEYYGPFGSRGVTQGIIKSLQSVLRLPTCEKKFPACIGKGRPCLNYHMEQCDGWCQPGKTKESYLSRIAEARQMLSGNYKSVLQSVRSEMVAAAELLDFECAASLRNKLTSIEALGKKQLVTASAFADYDVIGYGQTEAKACFAVMHFCGGDLFDKDYVIFPTPDDKENAVSSLVKQYYLSRGFAPKQILLPFEIEDAELFSQLLAEKQGRKTKLHVPVRGDNARRIDLANKNALNESQRATTKEEQLNGTLYLLGKMLSMDAPKRIESFDISNISGTDIVASMVVFKDGKPQKSDYKKFKIEGLADQNDYASMGQVISRRFTHYLEKTPGFERMPDLVLIDGGQNHALVACESLSRLGITAKVLGMVKDDKHRTRALVTPEGDVIHIDSNQSVFSLIGNIQEQTHNFAISYHRQLRRKRLRQSALDKIPGVGPKRKALLMTTFRSVRGVREASLNELERVLPADAARSVFDHFHNEKEEG